MSAWKCSECGSTNAKRRAKGLCQKCYHRQYIAMRTAADPRYHARESRASYQRNRENRLARMREKRRRLKWEVIEKLGGKCACCGETTLEFLTVHHIDNDGADHRRKTATNSGRASSVKIHRDIRNQGFPRDRYGVLCSNCNSSIGWWGYCPHTHTRSTKYPIRLGSPLPPR